MPVFGRTLGKARQVRAFLKPQSAVAWGSTGRRNDQAGDRERIRRPASERKKRLRSEIKSKMREVSR